MDAYLVLAEDLVMWELDDLAKGLDTLGLAPRAEGKTAFPDVGDMIAAVRAVKVARLEARWQAHQETAEDAAKAIWARERAEEKAAGGRVKCEGELRLEALVKAAGARAGKTRGHVPTQAECDAMAANFGERVEAEGAR